VEAGGALNEVVIRGSHHRRLDSHGLLVIARGVLHEGPDPQRSLVVWAQIVPSHVLLAELVVVGLGCLAQSLVSPSDGGVVDLSASATNLIILVEVGELGTAMELDFLSRAELCLDLRG